MSKETEIDPLSVHNSWLLSLMSKECFGKLCAHLQVHTTRVADCGGDGYNTDDEVDIPRKELIAKLQTRISAVDLKTTIDYIMTNLWRHDFDLSKALDEEESEEEEGEEDSDEEVEDLRKPSEPRGGGRWSAFEEYVKYIRHKLRQQYEKDRQEDRKQE